VEREGYGRVGRRKEEGRGEKTRGTGPSVVV